MNHFIELCRICGDVISQCRCPDLNKEKRYGVCAECAAPTKGKMKQPIIIHKAGKIVGLIQRCDLCNAIIQDYTNTVFLGDPHPVWWTGNVAIYDTHQGVTDEPANCMIDRKPYPEFGKGENEGGPCPDCEGRGQLIDEEAEAYADCPVCDGTGWKKGA